MESTSTARCYDPEGKTDTDTPTAKVDIQPAVFADDVIVPAQFFLAANDSPAFWTGERRLLFAVLQGAVDAFLRYRNDQTTRGKRLFREEQEWLWSTDRDSLCTFENICAYLDIEPDTIRRGLTRFLTAEPAGHILYCRSLGSK